MLDKFLFGNKHIPEMYFGNIPVSQIYFGNTLIWEKEGYVPYDGTCSIIITGDDTTQKFTVQVLKNGNDVTSSLDHFNGWAYIVNDVLPSYRMFLHNIPYSSVITSAKEFTVTELINGCKEFENITDSRYDDTKGEYHIDANQITSKAGGSFPGSGTISCQSNIVVPYTLTEDYSTNDVWLVVKQNVSDTPMEIKTLQVATTFTNQGNTTINVLHESGILIYSYSSNNTPSIITKTIGGVTYNYVVIDLTALSTGTFKLKRNEKYYIRVKHEINNNNHYYYRNGGILGIVGYVTGNINLPYTTYDANSLTYKGSYSNTSSMLSNVNANNYYARYTGTSDLFSSNNVYKCKVAFTYTGETSLDYQLLMMNDGELGSYIGESGSMSLGHYTYVKSGAPVNSIVTNNYAAIYGEQDSSKIFKYTGNDVGDIFYKNHYFSCNTPTTVKAEITSEPDRNSVQVGDVYFATSGIWSGAHSSGWNGAGFYKVTNIDSGNDNYFTVVKQNSPVTDETNNMKAKLTAIYSHTISTYYDTLVSTDLSNVTINTDHKHEILMGS